MAGFRRRILRLGAVYCEHYSGDGISVLALDDVVEVAEISPKQEMHLSELISRYGKAHRIFGGLSDTFTYVYGQFAAEVRDGMVRKVILFEKNRNG